MKTWQRLPWQNPLWAQMTSCNLAHAYLLRGKRGVGKFQFAKALSAWCLCHNPQENQACGHCKECALLQARSHPDFRILEPDEPSKPIRIDKIRMLNEFSGQTAQQGGRKVIIINSAEMMNMNAANALLKCLEEPSKNMLFLLVSAHAENMLLTIKSRCQQLKFSTPDRPCAERWLAGQLEDSALVPQSLNMSANAPLEAKRLTEEGLLEKKLELAKGIKTLFAGMLTPVELAADWYHADLILVLSWLISWLDDSVKLGLQADNSQVKNHDQLTILFDIALKNNVQNIFKARDWLIMERQFLLKCGNLNPQMLIEGAFNRYLELVL